MRHLQAYVERVSQEDAGTTDVEIPKKDPVVDQVESEPEPVEELISDMIVEPDPAADSARAELDETMQIQTSIEHYQELLRGAEARGGLRPTEGALLGVSVRHFQKRLGMDGGVLSMEDFGGNMSRLKATTVSQEGLADMAVAAGKKIMELIRRLVESMKGKLAAFDAKGVKVKAIVGDLKKRVSTFVTGETTFQWDGNTYCGVNDLKRPQTMLDAIVKMTAACDYLDGFFGSVKDAVVKLLRQQGDEDALEHFQREVTDRWSNTNPFQTLFRDSVGFALNSTSIAHLSWRGTEEGDAFSHSMKLDTVKPKPIDTKITKNEFKQLLDQTDKLNDAMSKLIQAASKNSGTVGSINGIQNQLGGIPAEAARAMEKSIAGVVSICEGDIMPIVSFLSSARGELGYMVAKIGIDFGKNSKA